mmetsp:Transcript_78256/g.131374  ORF Transcript_78256/g.131374 Transcript_78256/m.131374 type:complete len:98 (+) Transcript_78256:1454-1747(+)
MRTQEAGISCHVWRVRTNQTKRSMAGTKPELWQTMTHTDAWMVQTQVCTENQQQEGATMQRAHCFCRAGVDATKDHNLPWNQSDFPHMDLKKMHGYC